MKSKLEKRLDAELEARGVKTYTYHIKDCVAPFVGVTIVTESNSSFRDVAKTVIDLIRPFEEINRATKLKKRLANRGIYGIAICDERDQYNKKRGRIIAKGRLLGHLRKEK